MRFDIVPPVSIGVRICSAVDQEILVDVAHVTHGFPADQVQNRQLDVAKPPVGIEA